MLAFINKNMALFLLKINVFQHILKETRTKMMISKINTVTQESSSMDYPTSSSVI